MDLTVPCICWKNMPKGIRITMQEKKKKKKNGERSNIHYIRRVRYLGDEEATHPSLPITMALRVVSCSVINANEHTTRSTC